MILKEGFYFVQTSPETGQRRKEREVGWKSLVQGAETPGPHWALSWCRRLTNAFPAVSQEIPQGPSLMSRYYCQPVLCHKK